MDIWGSSLFNVHWPDRTRSLIRGIRVMVVKQKSNMYRYDHTERCDKGLNVENRGTRPSETSLVLYLRGLHFQIRICKSQT